MMSAPPTSKAATGGADAQREIDAYRKEKEEAVAELAKVKTDLEQVKKKLAELQILQEIEKGIKEKANKSSSASKKKKKKEKDSLGLSTSPSLSPSAQLLLSLATPACKHPKIPGIEDDEDSKAFYSKVAEAFPTMRLSDVLEAEKKFLAADKDHNGVIDVDELDRVLIVSVTVFTPGKVEEILKEMDTDGSGTIEFLEALSVMEKLSHNRRINLPDQVKHQQGKVCSVQ
ncbi:calmodulin-like protein 8 isoform X2 [Haliotis rufescens]|uniref:calmodulin-like protein 8 isoform X2 n=1 Tax=Haliotis rufescens TaxID=6454 RepID=UPI001EB071A8|nr:calmodulin-like protein 8 isoform X2 [Haliotis rufescens]